MGLRARLNPHRPAFASGVRRVVTGAMGSGPALALILVLSAGYTAKYRPGRRSTFRGAAA